MPSTEPAAPPPDRDRYRALREQRMHEGLLANHRRLGLILSERPRFAGHGDRSAPSRCIGNRGKRGAQSLPFVFGS